MDPEMNPENVNGVNQNAASQSVANQNLNPGQSVTNQNVALPDQNLQSAQNPQPVQNPFVQNPPAQTPPAKSKRPILIASIIGALVLVVVIVCIICVVMMQNDENNGADDDATSNIAGDSKEDVVEDVVPDVDEAVAPGVVDVIDVEKFKQMTKAEAIAFLKAGQSTGGSMPKNYVGKEITDLIIVENHTVVSDVVLKYSYDTTDDLQKIAERWYGVLGHNDGITGNDYTIKEYDYYAIVTPNRIEGTNTCDYVYYGDCKSLLSFKRDYINYFEEETTPTSYNDVIYLNARDLETVERLLRFYSFFYNYGIASGHGNIYGSSFEEQDDKFVLTVYYVGVGLNIEKLNGAGGEMEYAMNLYSRQYAADKADGRLYAIRTGEDKTVNNIKSIPITQLEATSLLSR